MVSILFFCLNIFVDDFPGGMDAYVREFGKNQAHDDFYNDDNIISIFKNYTTTVISRYVDNPTVFAWEIANDPRLVLSVHFS